jgi:hypothetical protein
MMTDKGNRCERCGMWTSNPDDLRWVPVDESLHNYIAVCDECVRSMEVEREQRRRGSI